MPTGCTAEDHEGYRCRNRRSTWALNGALGLDRVVRTVGPDPSPRFVLASDRHTIAARGVSGGCHEREKSGQSAIAHTTTGWSSLSTSSLSSTALSNQIVAVTPGVVQWGLTIAFHCLIY